MVVKNSDEVGYNVNVELRYNVINLNIFVGGSYEILMVVFECELVKISCGSYGWMIVYVFVCEEFYFVLIDEEG